MPLVGTDPLKAYLDPADDLHKASLKAFELLAKGGDVALSSASLLELDLVLKSSAFSVSEREKVFHTLHIRLVKAGIAPLNPEALHNAIAIQRSLRWPVSTSTRSTSGRQCVATAPSSRPMMPST